MVVVSAAVRVCARRDGARVEIPTREVVAGDILSPGQTEAVTAVILDWARGI